MSMKLPYFIRFSRSFILLIILASLFFSHRIQGDQNKVNKFTSFDYGAKFSGDNNGFVFATDLAFTNNPSIIFDWHLRHRSQMPQQSLCQFTFIIIIKKTQVTANGIRKVLTTYAVYSEYDHPLERNLKGHYLIKIEDGEYSVKNNKKQITSIEKSKLYENIVGWAKFAKSLFVISEAPYVSESGWKYVLIKNPESSSLVPLLVNGNRGDDTVLSYISRLEKFLAE